MDECSINNGECEQMCNNTIGSFYCTCGSGYQLDENRTNCSGTILSNSRMIYVDSACAVLCVDINECQMDDDNCHENAQCNNTEGSFTCFCNPGYTGNGVICTSKWQLLFYHFCLPNELFDPTCRCQ